MSERFTINKGEHVFNVYAPVDDENACGKNGQVKGATCIGRTIKLGGQELNRGSAIDFLREQVLAYNHEHADAPLALPEKGWFFGFSGTSTKDIKTIFNTLYPIPISTLIAAADAAKLAENYECAAALYQQAADRGDDYACFAVASLYETGQGVIQDRIEAIKYLLNVRSEESVALANFKVAEIWHNDQNDDLALHYYIKSHLHGHAEAFTKIQEYNFTPKNAYDKALEYSNSAAPDRAVAFLMYAAEQGHLEAMYMVVALYEAGSDHVEEDPYLAHEYLKKIVKSDQLDSDRKASTYCRLGQLETRLGYLDDAYTSYLVAADLNHAYAMYLLGKLYANEYWNRQDNNESLRWYQQSADLGCSQAEKVLSIPEIL